MHSINIQQKLAKINDYWSPGILAELNGQHIKLAKLKGEFVWHQHENEDEAFLVLSGILKMEFIDHSVTVQPGELIVIPKGVSHRPVADNEVHVLLFEPATTLNTGDASESEHTRKNLERL